MPVSDAVLTQILAQLEAMQIQQQTMQAKVMVSVSLLYDHSNLNYFHS